MRSSSCRDRRRDRDGDGRHPDRCAHPARRADGGGDAAAPAAGRRRPDARWRRRASDGHDAGLPRGAGRAESLRARGLRLGVLAQSAADATDSVLRFAGLRDRFELVLSAQEAGAYKLDPRLPDGDRAHRRPRREVAFVSTRPSWRTWRAPSAGLRSRSAAAGASGPAARHRARRSTPRDPPVADAIVTAASLEIRGDGSKRRRLAATGGPETNVEPGGRRGDGMAAHARGRDAIAPRRRAARPDRRHPGVRTMREKMTNQDEAGRPALLGRIGTGRDPANARRAARGLAPARHGLDRPSGILVCEYPLLREGAGPEGTGCATPRVPNDHASGRNERVLDGAGVEFFYHNHDFD